MNTTAKPIPAGLHSANVYLIVHDAAKQIAFLEQAFGAQEIHRSVLPDGNIIHAEVRIGDSTIMLGQANQQYPPRPATTYLYVDDVDDTFRRAVQAGGKSLAEPKNQFYGDRSAGVEDPCGNYWWIATHVEDIPHEEADRRFAEMGHKH